MSDPEEQRCLVTAPSGKDAALICGALARGRVSCQICATAAELVDEAQRGLGAVLVAEEALTPPGAMLMVLRLIERQPAWSDLPVVLLTKAGPASRLAIEAARALGNVTVLERPVPTSARTSSSPPWPMSCATRWPR